MVHESQSHAEEDEAKRKEIETRNKLDGLVYSTEKLVNESRDKLPESELKGVESAISDAKAALEDGSTDRMESAYQALTQAGHQMATVLYQSNQPPGGPAGGPEPGAAADSEAGSKGDDDEVIDAEYVDVDSEKTN
jgi:molecular chaperone DnaK